MNRLLKTAHPPRWLLAATAAMLLAGSASAQSGVNVANSYNYGSASWGVGTGVNAFNVTGTYSATANSGTDYFYNAGSNIEIAGNTAPDFYNLTFALPAASAVNITNTAGVNVTAVGTFNTGIVNTNRAAPVSGALRFLDGASYAGLNPANNIYVNGYVTKTGSANFTFPVGDQTGTDGRTLSVGIGAAATISVAYWKGDAGATAAPLDPTGGAHSRSALAPGLASVSPIGFWDFVTSSTNPAAITVSLPAQLGTGSYTIAANIRLVGYSTVNNRWEILGSGTPNNLDEGATLSGGLGNMSQYSAIGWGSITQLPLPVNLKDFTAAKTADGNASELRWEALSEQNMAYYTIERSGDAKVFGLIGEAVTPKGTGNGSAIYLTYDRSPINGANYYRLRMTGNDGSVTYSATKVVMFSDQTGGVVKVYPNPTQAIVHIEAAAAGNGKAQMFSASNGSLIATIELSKEGTASMNVSQYAAGAYFIRVSDEKGAVMANEKVNVVH